MLVSREPDETPIPHEPGEWIGLCKLSWVQLRDARKKADKENREVMKELGAEFLKVITAEVDSGKKKSMLRDLEYDSRQFDTETLLNAAIVNWSYGELPEDLKSEERRAQIASLDERTKEWAVDTIIGMNRPPSEAEEKKD